MPHCIITKHHISTQKYHSYYKLQDKWGYMLQTRCPSGAKYISSILTMSWNTWLIERNPVSEFTLICLQKSITFIQLRIIQTEILLLIMKTTNIKTKNIVETISNYVKCLDGVKQVYRTFTIPNLKSSTRF